jgi:hydrophobic/amphiphilic exporter-1 (mainly G- bacteria), HAE1 family
MVPIAALAQARLVQGPQAVVRYNRYRAAIVNGAPKPGYSSGVALATMERISNATLPSGYAYEWTATALQEKAAGGPSFSPTCFSSLSMRVGTFLSRHCFR